jgi:hypothetical protein
MTDRTRNQNQPDRGQQPSQDRSRRESPDMADDRGMTRDRRSFSGDREHDELGSEMEDDLALEDSDDLDMDDGFGGSGQSER